jgi:hypothetical protein
MINKLLQAINNNQNDKPANQNTLENKFEYSKSFVVLMVITGVFCFSVLTTCFYVLMKKIRERLGHSNGSFWKIRQQRRNCVIPSAPKERSKR